MDKHIYDGTFEGGSYSLALVGGNLEAKVSYSRDEMSVSASITGKSKVVLDELADWIPGTIDDAVIKMVEAALGL